MSLESNSQVSASDPNGPRESLINDPVDSLSDLGYPSVEDFLRAFSEPMSAEEFLRRGPQQPIVANGWPGTFWDREMIYDEHPTSRFPQVRPTADEILADLKSLAGTDRPKREYPEEFFSREVIYGG